MTPDSDSADLAQRMERLSDAEDFLHFFAISYDRPVVDVNRLHILKRFQQYVRAESGLTALDEGQRYRRYRELLARAYGDFVRSTPAQEKVFKVFQDADGQRVALAALRATLPARREGATRADDRDT